MVRSASERLQTATADDVRRLLQCVNALRVAIPIDRPAVLAQRLLAILDAAVITIDSGTSGDIERLATAAAAPGLPKWKAVVEPVSDKGGPRSPRHELRVLPTPVETSAEAYPAGVQSIYRSAGAFSAITAWRPTPFDENQQLLLQLIHPEIVWIFEGVARSVPENLESVLRLMLEGKKERDIAQQLGRSEHTVHAHVKRVYRHFGVNSRKQLLLTMYGSEKPS